MIAVVALAGCRPPLRVSYGNGTVILDMQSLGEYPSDVERIRVTDLRSGDVVWDLEGRNDPQIGLVTLFDGDNSVHPRDIRHGSYEVTVPANTSTFRLESGVKYSVEIWRHAGSNRSRRRATIEFAPKH